jgi:hypothetical protein
MSTPSIIIRPVRREDTWDLQANCFSRNTLEEVRRQIEGLLPGILRPGHGGRGLGPTSSFQCVVDGLIQAHRSALSPGPVELCRRQCGAGDGYAVLIGNAVIRFQRDADGIQQRLRRAQQPAAFLCGTRTGGRRAQPDQTHGHAPLITQLAPKRQGLDMPRARRGVFALHECDITQIIEPDGEREFIAYFSTQNYTLLQQGASCSG